MDIARRFQDVAKEFPQRPFIIFDGKGAAAKIRNYSINGSVFDPQSCKKGESDDRAEF